MLEGNTFLFSKKKKFFSYCIRMNHLRLEKGRKTEENITKDVRNLSKLINKNEPIKKTIIRDIRNLLQSENVEKKYK